MVTGLRPRIGWGTHLAFGVGGVVYSVKTGALLGYLMLFYNQVLGLPTVAVSVVLMISLVCDALFDPLIGQISDNFRSAWGRRHPFLYVSALPTAVLFIMLWNPPAGWSELALTFYLAACVIGVRFFDTFFDLPYQALVPELAPDYNGRTSLFAVSKVCGMVGGLAVSLLALNLFMKENPDGSGGLLAEGGYGAYGVCAATVIFVASLLCAAGLHHHIPYLVKPPVRKIALREMAKEMAATLSSASFAILAALGLCMSISMGISSALEIYWSLYFYQFTQAQLSLLMAPALIVGLVGTLATPFLSGRLGKRNAVIVLLWIALVAGSSPLIARLFDVVPAQSDALLAFEPRRESRRHPGFSYAAIALGSCAA